MGSTRTRAGLPTMVVEEDPLGQTAVFGTKFGIGPQGSALGSAAGWGPGPFATGSLGPMATGPAGPFATGPGRDPFATGQGRDPFATGPSGRGPMATGPPGRDPFMTGPGVASSFAAGPFATGVGPGIAPGPEQPGFRGGPGNEVGGEGGGRVQYGPDGMPLEAGGTPFDAGAEAEAEARPAHQGVEIHDQGWFHAESNRLEQEQLARVHLETICQAVDARQMVGLCPDARWRNDPEVFPDLDLRGTSTCTGVAPFPPHDQQYFVCGTYDPEQSTLRATAIPNHMPDEDGNSSWVRLVDFADHSDACHLFDEFSPHKTHFGRVVQGALDNGYFIEALQAVSLRPKLARQLFYAWDTRRSVYIARLYKHGTWMRVEVDDFVPIGPPSLSSDDPSVPICCRSEFFPHVLWPSLIEKAYAKVHTLRGSTSFLTPEDRGGWEAIGGGGRVEEALADLTGGVAGRFSTSDVTPERLFVYLHELQRDTLFVCRPHSVHCDLHGVALNPYFPNVVNRSAVYEGKLYVQIFCGAPVVYDGGLQDVQVPYGLIHSEQYPERSSEGFFWMSALDFHQYFDTIFECRLVNSGDVSIKGMPPPRLPGAVGLPPGLPVGFDPSVFGGAPLGAGPGMRPISNEGSPFPWFEWVHANPGEVGRSNEPEFTIRIPEREVPCEIVASVEQLDPRMLMTGPRRSQVVPLLVKVYESVEGNTYYSKDLVCKSNWLPVRDAMVAFTATQGGQFRIVAEFPKATDKVERLIFRCYASRPNVIVTAATATNKHLLVVPIEPPRAQKGTLVGVYTPTKVTELDRPQALDEEHDSMRKPEFDLDTGWGEFKEEVKETCSLM